MSVFANTPFSRLWNGRSRSDTQPRSVDFVGDAAPPFTELAESGLGRVPTPEELGRVRYYYSKIAFKDSEFVVRACSVVVFKSVTRGAADLCVVPGYGSHP